MCLQMCYGCVHVQVTGEVQVTLEIQGNIKERKDNRYNIHTSTPSWSQDAKRRALFVQDNTSYRVSITTVCLCISIESLTLVSFSFPLLP
jgi:hypothetical protein